MHAVAVAVQHEEALEEKRVPARAHEVEEFARNPVEAVAAQRAGGVLREMQEVDRQEMAQVRQRAAQEVPTRQAVALHVPGRHRDGVALGRFQQPAHVGRLVGEIAVHRQQRLVAVLVGVADAVLVGAADAELAGPVHGADVGKLLREPVDDRPRAVGRAVVAKHEVRAEVERAEFAAHALDVLGFVVGRDEEECAAGGHGGRGVVASCHCKLQAKGRANASNRAKTGCSGRLRRRFLKRES